MNITLWSMVGVGLYILLTVIIGYFAFRKNVQGDIADYFLAGRAVGTLALIGTLFATWFSTFAFIGGPATFYRTGVNWLLFSFFNVFGPMTIWFIGSRFWALGRKFGFITPSDMLGNYYRHEGIRLLVAVIGIIALFPYAAIQLSGVAKTFEGLTGGTIPYWAGVLMVVLGVAIYSYMGGARAVVWTDAIQGFFFAAFLIWTAVAVVKWAGGWETGWAKALAAHPERMVFTGKTAGSYFTNQLLWVFGWVLTPHLWQRMYMARSARVLGKSMVAASPLSLWVVTFSGAVIGFMAMGIMSELPKGYDADSLVALLYSQFAPIGGVLLLVSAFAAGMSTVDSQLLSVVSIFTRDVYQGYMNPKADGKALARAGHQFHILFIAAILVFTLLPAGRTLITPLASIGVGLCLLFLPAVIGVIYWEGATSTAVFWGLLVGFLTFLTVQFVPGVAKALPGGFGAPFWGFVINLAITVVVSQMTKPLPEAHRAEYHGFLKALNSPGGVSADQQAVLAD